jgi:hypothetical protein
MGMIVWGESPLLERQPLLSAKLSKGKPRVHNAKYIIDKNPEGICTYHWGTKVTTDKGGFVRNRLEEVW